MKKLLVFVVMVCMVGSSTLADLRGHWELDGNALDSSAYGNNGTIYGGITPTEDRNGTPNGAMAFDGGSSTYIDLGDQPEFNITGEMTLMAWCWLDSSCTTAARVIAKQAFSRSWSLNTETSWGGVTKPPVMWIASNSSSQVEVYDKATMPLDQWFHLAGVYTPGESMKLYINGTLVETRTDSVPASQFSDNGASVRIGNRNDASLGWKGKLDDVRIYTDALSEPEIEAIVLGAPVVKASAPSPGDAATGVGINDDLSWTAGVYALSHDIYFGTDQNAVMNAQRLLGDINGDGPADILDLEILASQWLTDPGATNPSADIAFSSKVDLEDFAALAADWGVIPDSAFIGNQLETTFDPGTMDSNVTYYWRVDEVNGAEPDSPWEGDVWSFTTEDLAPGQASIPSPGDGASGVGVDDDLSWVAGSGATLHAVYFGQDSTPDEGEFQGNQTGVTFEPGTMQEGETYYWRVDEINAYGTTTGTVWSFTVGGAAIVKIMPLGDSITQGYTTYDNYRHYLWDKLQAYGYSNVNFVGSHDVLAYDTYDSLTFDKDNEGHYGWETDEIVNGGGIAAGGTGNLTTWLTGLQAASELPDIVLMHLGTNDVTHNPSGYDQSITIGEMEDVIDVLRSFNPNVTILLAKIIPHQNAALPSVDDLNALIPALDSYETATSEVIIVDHYTGFLTSWLADDYHPNTTGAIEMSNRWFNALLPILGQSGIDAAGYWKLDEPSGSTAHDSSGNGNDGTLVNMDDSDWVGGMVSGALDFDGVDDYVSIARSSTLETGNATTHELSVSAWVRSDYTSAPTNYNTIIGTGDGGWLIANSPDSDTIYFACWLLNGASGQTAVASNSTVIFDGGWHHIVGVYDGSSVHMYVDGTHGEAGTIGGTIRNIYDKPVFLGENAFATGRRWDGLIDDVRIYDIGLSEEDVAYLENPNIAWNPSPADNATSIDLEADLSWSKGVLSTSHDVYLGTDSVAVESATNGSSEFQGNQIGTTFDPGTLDPDTTYYWRIDEVNASEPGSPWTGPVWSFTTASLKASKPSPADGSTASVNTTLSWTAGFGAVSHDVYFGTTSPGTYQGNQSGTTFDPGVTLDEGVVYYWRIDEVSSYGTTTGTVWSFTATVLPRVIVSSDIGGNDPDDFQSMVHYLVNADRFDTEGLIASPPYGGRVSDILATLDAYETDYNNLNSHASFPTPQSLRDMSKQGAINASPSAGYSTATEGSNWIISCANSSDPRPLWILVWGSITDVAQAVHDDPSIKSKIRVYSIGSWNTDQDPYARNYLYNNHPDLWWIENDTTFRGMYIGGDQSGDLGNTTFVEQNVRYHGALGDFFYSKKTDIKMGDTPSVLYMLNGDQDDPTTAHWGGMFGTTGHGTNYWHDLTDPVYAESGYNGAKTVNVHRESFLRDWQTRMDWAAAP